LPCFTIFVTTATASNTLPARSKASGAFLVGIASLFTAYSDMALAVARTVKAALPHCTVVLGGHHPTALPAAAMSEPAVDLVLRGEGEASLPACWRRH
jgi:anaerobic magnesium-protoporphyrin IX monomethyl ester cyclase